MPVPTKKATADLLSAKGPPSKLPQGTGLDVVLQGYGQPGKLGQAIPQGKIIQ